MFGVQPQNGGQPESTRHLLPLPRTHAGTQLDPILAQHPATVYIREAAICAPLNRWIATLFDATNRAPTIQALVESQSGSLADANVSTPATD
jgi:hypothetical protein